MTNHFRQDVYRPAIAAKMFQDPPHCLRKERKKNLMIIIIIPRECCIYRSTVAPSRRISKSEIFLGGFLKNKEKED